MPRSVRVACGVSFVIGLVFVFVAAPHPWGWEGIDQYHQLALAIARRGEFPTMEVPWGYAAFLAAFYRTLGDRPWIPLVAQVVLNAAIPALTYSAARRWFDRRTAVTAALLVSIFSFNTLYASTQSSDSVCTVLFMAAVVVFAQALEDGRAARFALAGVLAGAASQFRPNLVLVAPLLALIAVIERRTRRAAVHAALLVACAAAVMTPWIVRNYRLTNSLIPTSVHGGVQLWYGTLQVRSYLSSRAYNPRAAFEAPAFDYTSLADVPVVVEAQLKGCAPAAPRQVELTYWTDRDPAPRRIALAGGQREYQFEIPPPGTAGAIYYYFSTRWPGDPARIATTPAEGNRAPFVFFVSQDHLGDLDAHGDVLDVFDVVRLLRHAAWREPVRFDDRLRAAGVDSVESAVQTLMGSPALASVNASDGVAVARFVDGSSLAVPRDWSGRITDVSTTPGLAQSLLIAHVALAPLVLRGSAGAPPDHACLELEDIRVNDVFYRREPQAMRRYSTLALDNIRRDPLGFLAASAYRAVRLFVIEGTTDRRTTVQFSRSRWVYLAGTAASVTYLALLIAGIVVARRRGDRIAVPLALILYVPLTIAPVLTNMRYTITVQPLIFMFVAAAVTALAEARAGRRVAAEFDRAGIRTARRP